MGGKAFDDTTPINQLQVGMVIHTLFPFLSKAEVKIIGSGALLRSSYNDLDIAVCSSIDVWDNCISELSQQFQSRKISENVISFRIPSTDNAFHQVDLMRTVNLEYTVTAYHSSDNSQHKGAHRNILLMAMVKVLSLKDIIPGEMRTRQHLDLNEGLMYLVQKKSPAAIRYKTIDKVRLSFDFMDAINRFLPKVTKDDLDSVETVYAALRSQFNRDEDETLIEILTEAKAMMTNAGLDIPMSIRYWIHD